ncbi:MAG TPA: hypothetical protein VFL47_05875, partial [Flavisolibacter sp.]|nr:hypothetical protein [Flavisolibacter sp.]
MLELDDIQHYLLTRPHASIAQYIFITFKTAEGGRKWISDLSDIVGTAQAVMAADENEMRWVSLALTFNGLRKLGVDEAHLATFPEPFRQGMAARAKMLGDTGINHPDNWEDKITSEDLHAVVILFAKDREERERCEQRHNEYLKDNPGVEILSDLLLEAVAPLEYVHEHFGYRDRLTTPVIEGMGIEPAPGSLPASKPGEFFLGYPDETGYIPIQPQPEILSKNGSFLGYRKIREHVGAFRDFLKAHGNTEEEQELVAAKIMGR